MPQRKTLCRSLSNIRIKPVYVSSVILSTMMKLTLKTANTFMNIVTRTKHFFNTY